MRDVGNSEEQSLRMAKKAKGSKGKTLREVALSRDICIEGDKVRIVGFTVKAPIDNNMPVENENDCIMTCAKVCASWSGTSLLAGGVEAAEQENPTLHPTASQEESAAGEAQKLQDSPMKPPGCFINYRASK